VANVALIVIAVVLLAVGLGTATPKAVAAILLLMGILALLALAVIQVARSAHRRR
jgi:hypothetical protein